MTRVILMLSLLLGFMLLPDTSPAGFNSASTLDLSDYPIDLATGEADKVQGIIPDDAFVPLVIPQQWQSALVSNTQVLDTRPEARRARSPPLV